MSARRSFTVLAAVTLAASVTTTTARAADGDTSYEAQRAAIPQSQVTAAETAVQADEAAGTRPVLRVPFTCGEHWSGASRTGHSPSYWALDLNWGSGDDDLGKPVKSSASGTVVRSAFDAGGYGNYIEIAHGNGWHTLYAHLRARAVAVGDHVSDSTRIGQVGQTGNVTGPHLHYEQIKDGVVVRAKFGASTWAEYPGPKTYTRTHDC
jgi:hypothetical protein